MSTTASATATALDAATLRVRTTVAESVARVAQALAAAGESSARIAERDLLIATQFELRRHGTVFIRTFGQTLREKVEQALAPREDGRGKGKATHWSTLTLVDDAEMDERLHADRIGQAISHACDAELREVGGYLEGLLPPGRTDLDRNPLRPEILGAALYRGIEAVVREADARQLLAREFGQALAKAMPACYAGIVQDLQARGLRPALLTARGVEGPGVGGNSGYATFSSTQTSRSSFDAGPSPVPTAPDSHRGGGARSWRGGSTSGAASTLGGAARSAPAGRAAPHDADVHPADVHLMALLRRLTAAVSRPGALDMAPRPSPGVAARDVGTDTGRRSMPNDEHADSIRGQGATGLMAVNLIHAHREELLQASTGQLDHMVIDVVGSLFDQILSDARVPPQMARQIARLQLPVLRVALRDASFFSSRRHPVRRFVNRMASLACAFEDFDEGPGRLFIERVCGLVQEIVDGDFDRIDLYTAKVGELERFIAAQAEDEARENGAAEAIDRKEAELRLQQRHRLRLQSALVPLGLPAYLGDFLAQVWSQAMVLADGRDGTASDRAQRYRRTGRDLVLSVQPKGSPAMRKKFLMQLPPLMKDLNEGMKLVGWPDAAQREFLAQLLPAHAESLRASPLSELDYNMLARRLEGIFSLAAEAGEPLAAALLDAPDDAPPNAPPAFSPEEARRVGLVDESAVDWSGTVDIEIDADLDIDLSGPDALAGSDASGAAAASGRGSLPALDAPASEPTRGPALMGHIQPGFAYQMHLKDEWQKVRLTHVSAGRSFFVFSRGRKHPETISMTSRMLARMCETGRLRAVESAYLMERATQRARRQLAALTKSTAH